MLVIQQNCGKGYECTTSVLEAGLGLNAGIVCIQEPFLGRKVLSHAGFSLFWPSGTHERKDNRVLIAVKKDLLNKTIVENRTDLVSHPYAIVLDITEREVRAKGQKRRTRIVNVYDNKLGRGQTWGGSDPRLRRAIQDISWEQILKGRVLVLGNMNAHSPMWNPHCQTRKNSGPLEALIDRFELIVNKNPDYATRPISHGGVSIIDLALSSPELGPLSFWEIPGEYPSLSDHELILLGWDNINNHPSSSKATSKRWSIQRLLEDETLCQEAKIAWLECSTKRPFISELARDRSLMTK